MGRWCVGVTCHCAFLEQSLCEHVPLCYQTFSVLVLLMHQAKGTLREIWKEVMGIHMKYANHVKAVALWFHKGVPFCKISRCQVSFCVTVSLPSRKHSLFYLSLFAVGTLNEPVPESFSSSSSHHLNILLTEELHFVLSAVSQVVLCAAAEETSSLLAVKASTWVTPGPGEIGIR